MKKKVKRLDANGQPVLDEQGNPIFDEIEVPDGDGNDLDPKDQMIANLRKENAERRVKAKELSEQMAALEAKFAAIDLEKYDDMLKREKELEEQAAKKSGDFESMRKKLVEDSEKTLRAKDEELNKAAANIKQLEAAMDKLVMSYEIALQASAAEAINPKLLELAIAQEAFVEQGDDGSRSLRFKDAVSGIRLSPKTGLPFTLKERLEEMKQDPETAMLFKGGKYGTGSSSVPGGPSAGNPWKKETFNLTEQGKITRESPDLAKRLRAEAGVKDIFE